MNKRNLFFLYTWDTCISQCIKPNCLLRMFNQKSSIMEKGQQKFHMQEVPLALNLTSTSLAELTVQNETLFQKKIFTFIVQIKVNFVQIQNTVGSPKRQQNQRNFKDFKELFQKFLK